ncbi:MAG: sulfatase [Phycisphaerales bacterium]|nr:sulfatase [Phycisphaerales bacterium]
MNPRPNVVLFIPHDTGCHVSPYGVKTVHTPNCERLVREGVRFAHSFCTSPLCSPARAACVTGRYPHQNGVMGLTSDMVGGFDFYPGERHAATIFNDAGYNTVLCGFEHETPHWQKQGFQQCLSGPGGWYNGGGDLRNHAREIENWVKNNQGDKPFYMQMGCHETHHAWSDFDTPPDETLGLTIPPYLKDLPEVRREVAQFQGAIRRLDDELGNILDTFDRLGLSENTIFVFTTDHGIDFPRAKGTLYDAGTGVFLFIRYPAGNWGQGRVIDDMVSQVDLLPTLLEACGIAVPGNISGRSYLPLLEGRAYQPNQTIFTEKTYHDTYDPSRAVRTDRYKYIRHFEVNIFQDLRLATETRRHYMKHDWRRRTLEELYDLQTDPNETHNLVADAHHQPILEKLRVSLLQWMRETQDPLLQGPVPSPHFARQLKAFNDSATKAQ